MRSLLLQKMKLVGAELFITSDDSINFNESVKQSTFFIVSSSKAAARGQEERRVKMGGP